MKKASSRTTVGFTLAAVLVGAPATAYAVAAPAPQAPVRIVAAQTVTAARTVTGAPLRPAVLPRSYQLKVHEQYQLTNYYCVPASSSMSLSTFGVKVSQGTLARLMKTTTYGTGGGNAARVIDGYINPRRYDDRLVGDVVAHPDVLMERVSYDVGALRRAPVIQVWMEKLPWNKGKVAGRWIGHAIIAYGYNKAAGTITVFDPWRPTGGAHTLSATSLATTLQNGAGMHYISRL